MTAPYQLGDWTVEPARRRIRRGQEQHLLEPKSLAVLQCLAARPGEVVSWERLIDEAWQGRVVSDDAVHRQVSKLRNLLGDDPRAPHYIETLPTTGFRLLAPVRPLPGSAAAADRAPLSSRVLRWLMPAVAAVGLAVFWLLGERAPPDPDRGHGQIQQLTAAPGLERFPALSPSGRSLVYARRAADAGRWQLQVMELATRQPRPGVFRSARRWPSGPRR